MRSSMRSIAILVFALAACGDKAPPVQTPAAATAALPAVTAAPAASRGAGQAVITDTPADPARMPNDSVHAGLRPGARAAAGGAGGPAGAMPAGHPPLGDMGSGAPPARPMGGPMAMGDGAVETDVPLPLPLVGSGSVAELKARLAVIADTTKHGAIDEAFRKLFTVDRAQRDGARAKALLEPLATDADAKVSSTALRMLGYVALNSGFDAPTATARYEQALALDADYGEAHYALAFVLAISDRVKGKVHFDKAIALGVPDVRKLADQFYGGPSHP